MDEQKTGDASHLNLQNDPKSGDSAPSDGVAPAAAPAPDDTGAKEPKKGKARRLSLADRIVIAAVMRIGHVLKPYPKGEGTKDINSVLDMLKERGLINYPAEHPNLTAAGLAVARRLVGTED